MNKKKLLSILIIMAGTIGILSHIINDVFIEFPDTPLKSLEIFRYFTIQSNLVAVLYFTIILLFRYDDKDEVFKNLVGGVTVYITITFLVFMIILEKVYDPVGLALVGSICLHYINPILVIIFLVVQRRDYQFNMKDAFGWMVYPLLYIAFSQIYGLITGDYIYWFLASNELGFLGFLIAITVLVGLFFLLSFILVKIVSKKE